VGFLAPVSTRASRRHDDGVSAAAPTRPADDLVKRFADSLVGKTEEDILALAYKSPAVHFACFVTIRDKNNRPIQPVPNILQLRMSEAYETMREMGVKVRIIVVKPRRAGCSTFGSHILYHHGQRVPCEGITISDVKEHSAELMAKIKEHHSGDSFPWGHSLVRDSTHSLAWTNGTKWTIDSAENPDAGVGGTRQLFHGSEVSKWPQTAKRNDKTTMAAVLPSLSGSDTVGIAESTPERAAGWHYTTWGDAVTLEDFIAMHEAGICPEDQWVKVFAAWFEFDDNQRSQPVSEAEIVHLKRTLDARERNGIEKYGWTWEQVAWRRDTIRSICNGDPKIFDFYYPEDEVTCWLAGGSPRFDVGIINDMETVARGVIPDTGYLVTQDTGKVIYQHVRDGSGEIIVWEHPKDRLRYIVTIDPATDESQTIGADPDRHSVSVWRAGYHDAHSDVWRPVKKVARVKGPLYADGDIVAGHAVRLSRYFGNCIAVQEVNCGLDILRLLKEAGVPLYKRRPISHRTGQVVEQYGFKLNDQQERNAVIEGFAAAIRERAIEVHCLHSLGEYKLFVVKPNGRAEAAPGAHDDDVMADAMAWECMPSATEFREQRVQRADPRDRGPNGWRQVNNVRRGW